MIARRFPQVVGRLRGKLIGDRGYICAPLTDLLFEQGLQFITRLRKHMKDLMLLREKHQVRKRAISESIIDQFKSISPIEHSRHRSPTNFVVHLIAGCSLIAIKRKSPAFIPISASCWLFDRFLLSITHVPRIRRLRVQTETHQWHPTG